MNERKKTKFRIYRRARSEKHEWYEVKYKVGWFWVWLVKGDTWFDWLKDQFLRPFNRKMFPDRQAAVDACKAFSHQRSSILCSLELTTEL